MPKESPSGIYPSLPQKEISAIFYPAPAWIPIVGFAILTGGCLLIGAGKVLNFIFPVGSLAVGVVLYLRYPILYAGFCWWMCFLTPLIRRLADYRSGFTDPSPILLAQNLIFLIPIAALFQNLPKIHRQGGLPFVLCFASLFYGLLVGISQGGMPLLLIKAALEWLSPVLFGFYLFINWRDYPRYRQNLQRTFLWGALFMGSYGVYQYLIAPEWDTAWMINTEVRTDGTPEPYGIRVWSTMNGPLVFACAIMAALLLLFNEKSGIAIAASGVGYLTLLLSLVRTAWGGWLIGIITMFFSFKSSQQIRLILIFLTMIAFVVPLTQIEPFSEVIYGRLDTLSNLESDGSANVRSETYDVLIVPALTSLFGYGIGNVPDFGRTLDSTILFTLFSLGWVGSTLYLIGLLFLAFKLFTNSKDLFDSTINTARGVVAAYFFMLFFGSCFTGPVGIIFWAFLSMGAAAQKYYLHQNLTDS